MPSKKASVINCHVCKQEFKLNEINESAICESCFKTLATSDNEKKKNPARKLKFKVGDYIHNPQMGWTSVITAIEGTIYRINSVQEGKYTATWFEEGSVTGEACRLATWFEEGSVTGEACRLATKEEKKKYKEAVRQRTDPQKTESQKVESQKVESQKVDPLLFIGGPTSGAVHSDAQIGAANGKLIATGIKDPDSPEARIKMLLDDMRFVNDILKGKTYA